MLRLIDVALNILMAFIAVSRLKTDHIEMPSGANSRNKRWEAATPALSESKHPITWWV